MSLLPPREDRAPLVYFILQLLALSICAGWLPLLLQALYIAWVIAGLAFLVGARSVPALPRTFGGNLLRLMKAHAWPFFLAQR